MKRKLLLGISISLLVAMLLTSCGDTPAVSEPESSVPAPAPSSPLVDANSLTTSTLQDPSSQPAPSTTTTTSIVPPSTTTTRKVPPSTTIPSTTVKKEDPIAKIPITYINTIPSGQPIDYSNGDFVKVSWPEGIWFDVKIVKSFAQLQSLYDKNVQDPLGFPKRYNSAFFKDNALIIMYVTENGTMKPSDYVKQFTLEGDTLGMWVWTPARPPSGMEQMGVVGEAITFYEVKKSDIDKVTKIQVFRDVQKKYSEYTPEEFEKLDIKDNVVWGTVKFEVVISNKEFTLSDFPEVDAEEIQVYDMSTDGTTHICFILKEHSKQGVLEAIKRLEENPFVYEMAPEFH